MSAEQVGRLRAEGLEYRAIGARLGIAPGLAYLIGTGTPADGGHSEAGAGPRPGTLSRSQHLANPPHENPTGRRSVRDWIGGLVAADGPMRAAGRLRNSSKEDS